MLINATVENGLWSVLFLLLGVRFFSLVLAARSVLLMLLVLLVSVLLLSALLQANPTPGRRRSSNGVSFSVLALPLLMIALYAFAQRRAEIAACGVGALAALALAVDEARLRWHHLAVCVAVLLCGAMFYASFGAFDVQTASLQSVGVVLAHVVALRLLQTFTASFSLAELICLSQMLSVVMVRAAIFSRRALLELGDASRDAYWRSAAVRVECLLYGVAVGMTLIVVGCVPLLARAKRRQQGVGALLLAAAYAVFVLAALVTPLVSRIMRVNCWLWTLENVFAERHRVLLVTWLVLVALAVLAPRNASLVPLTVRRKYFHIISLVALVPPALMRANADGAGLLTSASSSALGRLASGVALAALCALELLRFGHVAPAVDAFMRSFTDERDAGQLIVTHIYLLIGCAAPLWIDTRFELHPMAAFTGLLIVGIGDAVASTAGSYFGRHKWPGAAPKSIEGTLGCFVVTMLSAWALNGVFVAHDLPHMRGVEQWVRFACATGTVSVMEAYMLDVDNLILPIAYLLALFAFGCA